MDCELYTERAQNTILPSNDANHRKACMWYRICHIHVLVICMTYTLCQMSYTKKSSSCAACLMHKFIHNSTLFMFVIYQASKMSLQKPHQSHFYVHLDYLYKADKNFYTMRIKSRGPNISILGSGQYYWGGGAKCVQFSDVHRPPLP